jgi:transposase-like protein
MPPKKGVSDMAQYKHYSKDFKLQAARLVTENGYSLKDAAKKLGVSAWSIRYWINKFRQTAELPTQNQAQSPAEELKQLRKENARLRMEVDILKKATAYFAKESQ